MGEQRLHARGRKRADLLAHFLGRSGGNDHRQAFDQLELRRPLLRRGITKRLGSLSACGDGQNRDQAAATG